MIICNTESGEPLEVEGEMSISRDFINARDLSTPMTMWSVDDCTTSDLMLLFYKELKEGYEKDEALQRAKINYMSSASKTKMHPYYWAAFVPFGDMKSIDLNTTWSSFPIFTLAICICLGVFFYVKSKRT